MHQSMIEPPQEFLNRIYTKPSRDTSSKQQRYTITIASINQYESVIVSPTLAFNLEYFFKSTILLPAAEVMRLHNNGKTFDTHFCGRRVRTQFRVPVHRSGCGRDCTWHLQHHVGLRMYCTLRTWTHTVRLHRDFYLLLVAMQ